MILVVTRVQIKKRIERQNNINRDENEGIVF